MANLFRVGGSEPKFQNKTVPPVAQTVNPDSGYDGLSSVTIQSLKTVSKHMGGNDPYPMVFRYPELTKIVGVINIVADTGDDNNEFIKTLTISGNTVTITGAIHSSMIYSGGTITVVGY